MSLDSSESTLRVETNTRRKFKLFVIPLRTQRERQRDLDNETEIPLRRQGKEGDSTTRQPKVPEGDCDLFISRTSSYVLYELM